MGTTVLGEPVSMPILIAPVALPGLAHPEGEIATVKAASAAKTLTTLATLSTTSIEDAMAVATGPVWFQLYVFKDRAITASLVQRAEAAGCKAVVLTVDMPMQGKRERDVRNRFTLPDHLSLKNFSQAGFMRRRPATCAMVLGCSTSPSASTSDDRVWPAQLDRQQQTAREAGRIGYIGAGPACR
jgi:isopentenyl diphosphate isomerase/L-lactate dehydrogenase-like FMN-dependent dehydrogenase